MVMDLVRGGELFDAVAKEGKLPEARVRLYFQQLVDGIHYCHTRRVYHRDLKPENLLLSEDKQSIKITDFGLSSIKASDCATELLHTIMGSPHYIAPEIITSAAAGYDGAKVDVWASGIILFGMLAGFLPFDEPITRDLYKAIVHAHVHYPPHFSYDVIKLLRAMLQKDPKKRPTMEEVRGFTWFKVNYQPAVPDDSSSLQSSVPTRSKKSRRKRKTSTDKTPPKSGHRCDDDLNSQNSRASSSGSFPGPISQVTSPAPETVPTTGRAPPPPMLATLDKMNDTNATLTGRDTLRGGSTDSSYTTSSMHCGDGLNDSESSFTERSPISRDPSGKDVPMLNLAPALSPTNEDHSLDSGYLFTYVDTPMATSRGYVLKNGLPRRDNWGEPSSDRGLNNSITFSTPLVSTTPSPSQKTDPSAVSIPTSAMAAVSLNSEKPCREELNVKHAKLDDNSMFISPVSVASQIDFAASGISPETGTQGESTHAKESTEGSPKNSNKVFHEERESQRGTQASVNSETESFIGREDKQGVNIFKPVTSMFKPLVHSLLTEIQVKGDALSSKATDSPALNDDWCIDSGDAFADVETDAPSVRCAEPRQASWSRRAETGSLKYLADLRQRQSCTTSSKVPKHQALSDECALEAAKTEIKKNAIFSALDTKLALKLSPSQEFDGKPVGTMKMIEKRSKDNA